MRAARVLVLILALSVSACSPADPRVDPASSADRPSVEATAPQGASELGSGFVVWESNRSKNWRIWIRDLEPSSPRRLSPEESGREHCCAHISPDGRWVTYLSHARTKSGYAKGGTEGVLHLIRADGTDDRILAPEARSSWENRAAVWKSDRELIYIRADGATVLHDLDGDGDGDGSEVLARGDGNKTWLINSRLTHAVSGVADFAPYDPTAKAIAQRRIYGGCQPYFSHDGRWAFWAAGTGGPIQRLDLETNEVSTILAKSDSRIPGGLGYAYFPMISRDGRLFTFAASDYRHDHFRADYEIFVAASDPDTLELQGNAVRMTSHPATDRFPDVFLAPLELGRHRGEAPFAVSLEVVPETDSATGVKSLAWDFGDGHRETTPASAGGGRIRHTYELSGRYEVRARTDSGQTLRGQVEVQPAAPPRVLDVELRNEGRSVVVRFDEPIATDPESTTARFASGAVVTGLSVDGSDRALAIELEGRIDGFDRLELDGVRDRAQRPNQAGSLSLEIAPPLWPSNRRGLTFLWETGEAANLVQPPAGSERATTVTAAGKAFLDHDFAMTLRGGHYAASVADVTSVIEGSRRSNELTVELMVRPEPDDSALLRRIVSFSGGTPPSRNFLLGQRGNELVFGLRAGNAPGGPLGEIEIGPIPASETSHWLLSYEVGRLTAYLDGEPVLETDALQGDFFQWKPRPLLFGNGPQGRDPWRGRLEGIAIYGRAVGPDEARENARRYRRVIAERTTVPRSVVEATLVAVSPAPSLEEITPYREALAVFEYRVDRVLEGASPGETVRVAGWSIRDGALFELNGPRQIGERSRLTLEPFAGNRQLESVYVADTLEPGGGPLYYAVP